MTGFSRIVSTEWMKLRRTFVWGLVALGPIGVIALQSVNFGLRYDYLTNLYAADLWGGLVDNVKFLSIPALMIGMTIVASLLAGYEHQTNAWKQTLALPVSKTAVYTGKLAVTALLLVCACALLAVGTVILGVSFGFGTGVPVALILKASFLPLLAAMPFVSLQVWLSVTMKNQAIPLSVGILGTVLSLYAAVDSPWYPYKWPYVFEDGGWSPLMTAAAGLVFGALLYAAGAIHFRIKDVK